MKHVRGSVIIGVHLIHYKFVFLYSTVTSVNDSAVFVSIHVHFHALVPASDWFQRNAVRNKDNYLQPVVDGRYQSRRFKSRRSVVK